MYKQIIFTILLIIMYMFSYNNVDGAFSEISEGSAIVMDSDGMSIIYSKNMNKKIYPASTTKILTAILAIENLNLDSNITASKTAVNVPYGSSTMDLKAGEIVTVRQLLYGLLLPSGNDAANVLAEAVSGNIQSFVVLMNAKLKELGCLDSHFANPHGFHNINHYTTAHDMALIMEYASKNEIFRNICATSEFTIQPTNKTPTARILKNTNSLLTEDLKYDLIGKTGYTDEAGNTFICFATYNGKNVICGLYDGPNYRKSIFKDVQMLLSNVFDNYSKTKILDKNTISISYLDKKTNKNYILGLDSDIYCLTDGNKYVLDYTFSDISVTNNTASGKINIHLQNNNFELNKTYDLNLLKSEKYSSNDSDGSMLTSIVIYILVLLGLVIVIFILILKQRYKKYLRYKRLKNLEKLNRFR